MENPFTLVPYVSDELFCDRKAETKTLMEYILNGSNVTLISPRRYGKTGLIYRVFDEIKQQKANVSTCYVDIYATETLEDFIKVFSGWEMAECTLLHEYVHYLTIHCAEQPTTLWFYAEGVAEYIAMIVCKNRMARSVNYCFSAEEIAQCKAHNAWDTAEDCIDLMKSYFSLADYYAQGVFVGFEYYSVSDVMELRTEQVQQNPTVYNVSHIEAACIMAYLVETYSRDTVFQNWGMEPDDIETVYGEPFSSLYQKWSAWNHERCAALGMN